jgi:hypothetical protein
MSDSAERPADLRDVQGAWRRDGRRLHGGPWEEVSDVLWLQAGRLFCDVRTARLGQTPTEGLDLPQAFGGTIEVAAGDIAFHHDLDSLQRDPAHPDVSTVHRVGRTMYERGPGFEERWILASRPGEPSTVAECLVGPEVLARVVRVGALALAVWGGRHPGGAQFSGHHRWQAERSSSREPDELAVEEAVRALGDGDPLPEDWQFVAKAKT